MLDAVYAEGVTGQVRSPKFVAIDQQPDCRM